MHVIVRAAAETAAPVMQLARRRMEFALGRFDNRLRLVSVRLSDVDGPYGGTDKKCVVTIRFGAPKRHAIVVEDVDADLSVAVDRAADRAARAVGRAVHALSEWRPARGRD